MSKLKSYVSSSVGKKQIVALSGIGLVGFLIAHLSGNLLIFKGPEAFNDYAAMLKGLGNLLNVARAGLVAMFALHIIFTIQLIRDNRKARGGSYAVEAKTDRSFATKTMRYTGPLVAIFLLIHLFDFTWTAPWEKTSWVAGQDLGIYGIVFNSFLNPLRAFFYIVAMASIGFHLAHGIQSVFQSFGIYCEENQAKIKCISRLIGAVVAIGFSAIPIYINVVYYLCGTACGLK